MPSLGATPFDYHLTQELNLDVMPTLSALAIVSAKESTRFRENVLFTDRGLSGLAILQISNFWQMCECFDD
ncbi:MAG: hypothetical protein GPOALKHO_001723 [Sodalis sp.]|nr:MAG: hypothetical protein GPOALKHO_001723 [Sodalis sp.]